MITYIYTTYKKTRLATQTEIKNNAINIVKCLPLGLSCFFGETRLYNNGKPTKKEAIKDNIKVYKKINKDTFQVGYFLDGLFKKTSLYN